MASRRTVLKSLFAASALPRTLWADAGSPKYLSAARIPDGSFRLFGIDANGEDVFSVLLPGRGHAAAAHPSLAEAIVFARRPGRFALVVDCSRGNSVARLESPPNRHFYGHGAFSAGGNLLFTTENDFESGQGRIGVWNRSLGYRRVGEFSSGGVGPHEIVAVRDAGILVVANGGIETHPETGRQKLNLPFMKPNLAYVAESGRIEETLELPDRLNSIRHLSVGGNGDIEFAMQWQSSPSEAPSLLGLHRRGGPPGCLAQRGDFTRK